MNSEEEEVDLNAYTIYLCGAIAGKTDQECKGWRDQTKDYFGHTNEIQFLDPMRRDYRGVPITGGVAAVIVDGDKEDIRNSNMLLVYHPGPSTGTDMEIMFAYECCDIRPIAVVPPDTKISPWLIHHCEIYHYFDEAYEAIYREFKKWAKNRTY